MRRYIISKNGKNIDLAKATDFCANFCTDSMISLWLSHYSVWQSIVKNSEDNVLVLEEDAIPVSDFNKKIQQFRFPKGWDIIFLGCYGSCDTGSVADKILSTLNRGKNVMISKQNGHTIFKPGFPLGFYGYLISNKGARNLLKNKKLKKVRYHLDYIFAKEVLEDVAAYAVSPPLIYPDLIDEKTQENHSMVKPLYESIMLSPQLSLDSFLNDVTFHIRDLGINITNMSIIVVVVALFIGLFGREKHLRNYVVVAVFIQLMEIAFMKSNRDKIKSLVFESVIGLVMILLGLRLKKLYRKMV